MKLIQNLKVAKNLINIIIIHKYIYLAFYSEEVTLEELLPYTTQLSFTWYELGQRLGLDSAKLNTVKFAIGTLEGRCQKMLEMWMSSEELGHTWETFLNALKTGQSRSSIDYQVADEIYNVHSIKVCIIFNFIELILWYIQTLMGRIFLAAQNKEVRFAELFLSSVMKISCVIQEDTIVWESWNFFLTKAGH